MNPPQLAHLVTRLGLACFIALSFTFHTNAEPTAAQPIEEIVVTAQKRAQNAFDVGISLSLVDQQQIQQKRITTVNDLAIFSSNTSIKEFSPGLVPIITIRGVGLNDYNAANNPTAGIYLDEVPLSSLALLNSDYFDLERIEVLKGPQGTLYGRNATAGAVNINSAKPKIGVQQAKLSFGVGNHGLTELEGMFNTPLSSDVTLRVAAKKIDQADGFFENDLSGENVGERDVTMARGQLHWQATAETEVLFKLEGQRARNELGSPEFFGLLPTEQTSDCPGLPECANLLGYNDVDGDPFRGAWSVQPDYRFDQTLASIKLNHEFGFATLSSITGWVDFERDYAADTDAGPFRIADFLIKDEVRQFSQEVRLTGEIDQLIWQAGLFYADDRIENQYRGELQDLLNTTSLSESDIRADTIAVFVNGEWSFNQQLSLQAGLRYSDEEKSNQGSTQDLVTELPGSGLTRAPFGTPPITLARIDDSISDQSLDWRLALNWRQENSLLYLSASKGTKSGGFFTGVATSQAQLEPYFDEQLIAYELGAKGQLANKALSYEAALFYYDYDDVQSYIRDNSGAVPVQRLGNIDGASILGAEMSLSWQNDAGLFVKFGIGLLDTEVEAFASPQGLTPKGNELPDAPAVSLLGELGYQFSLGEQRSLRLAIDARYHDEVYRDVLNDPLLQSDSFTVVNANALLKLAEQWEIAAWVRNLGDELYVTQGLNQQSFGNGFRVYGAPRTYGVTVTRYFD